MVLSIEITPSSMKVTLDNDGNVRFFHELGDVCVDFHELLQTLFRAGSYVTCLRETERFRHWYTSSASFSPPPNLHAFSLVAEFEGSDDPSFQRFTRNSDRSFFECVEDTYLYFRTYTPIVNLRSMEVSLDLVTPVVRCFRFERGRLIIYADPVYVHVAAWTVDYVDSFVSLGVHDPHMGKLAHHVLTADSPRDALRAAQLFVELRRPEYVLGSANLDSMEYCLSAEYMTGHAPFIVRTSRHGNAAAPDYCPAVSRLPKLLKWVEPKATNLVGLPCPEVDILN